MIFVFWEQSFQQKEIIYLCCLNSILYVMHDHNDPYPPYCTQALCE